MTYTRATKSEFIAIFPAFSSVSDAAYDYWATRAERSVTDAYGDDQAHATALATAHYLVMQGIGSEADSQRWANFAGATSVRSGSLSLTWDAALKTTGSRYGDEWRSLAVTLLGGPCVAGTGTFPVYPDYGGIY